jgi:thiol-disulfide isomerase/thioredoxin
MAAFTLTDLDGQEQTFPSDGAGRLTLLIFLKTSCGSCKTAFPFVQRLAARYGRDLTVWGISQSDATKTRQFAERYGCTFPFLLDQDLSVSTGYDPVGVPAFYLFAGDGSLLAHTEAFSRLELERLNTLIAEHLGTQADALFTTDDSGPVFRPACESNHRLAAAGLLDSDT